MHQHNEKVPGSGCNERTPLIEAQGNSHGSRKNSLSVSIDSGYSFGSLVSYHDICYKVTTKENGVKKKKEIIKHLSGVMQPGLNAILGPTGSGKTTLLDILAGRKDRKGLSGHVLIDGAKQPDNFKCISGYVVQEDAIMGTLTVRENLNFSASLRLPSSFTKVERKQRVETTLLDLGLTHVGESMVGNEFIRGISGGERKRTSIGMELIMSPAVLFLDEPTSGLDASTAFSVIQLLQGLGLRGKTVIMSIHQPRYSIFKMFDTISLLSLGEFVYQGPVDKAIAYFEEIGHVCEEHNNPADFFMDVIFEAEAAQRCVSSDATVLSLDPEHNHESFFKPILAEQYKSSSFAKDVEQMTRPIIDQYWESERSVGFTSGNRITYPTSFISQLSTVSGRAVKNIIRNPQTSVVQLIVMVIFGVIVGAIYFQLKKDESGIQNRVGVFFFLVMNMVFGNLSAVELFINERRIFLHESASGYYRVSAYFLSKVLCDLVPLRLIPITAFAAIVYFMTGLVPTAEKFFIFVLTLLLTSLCACSVAFLVSACVRTFAIANLLVALPYVFMMVFGGVLLNLKSVLDWLAWIKYISIFRYGIEALEINELHGMVFNCGNSTMTPTCPTGDQYLESQNIKVDDLWYNQIALGSMTVILMFWTYVALRLIKKEK